jgi:hypothetical protein
MFPVLLAKAVRTWEQALFIVATDDAAPLASSENGFQCSAAFAEPLLYRGDTKETSIRL